MIKEEDIKVGLKFLLPVERVERSQDGFRYLVETQESFYLSLGKPTEYFCVKSVKDRFVYCNVGGIESCKVEIELLHKNGLFYDEKNQEMLMKEWVEAISSADFPSEKSLEQAIDNFNTSAEKELADRIQRFREPIGNITLNDDVLAHRDICDKLTATYAKKNSDYGNAFSEMYDELGINYGYGKIREKVNRIKTLKDKEAQVANEPLEDALLDCANYCILTLMEYQKRKKDGKV